MSCVVYLFALPQAVRALKWYDLNRSLEEKKLVRRRRTVDVEWRWWCEFLSKKHEECAKLNGSDEPPCDVFKNGWLKDCATLDGVGKPKQVFVEGRSILRVKGIGEDYYFSGDAN